MFNTLFSNRSLGPTTSLLAVCFTGLLISAWLQSVEHSTLSAAAVTARSVRFDDSDQDPTKGSQTQTTQQDPKQSGRLLRRLRNRLETNDPATQRPAPLMDRVREGLGVEPGTRLIPGIMGNDPSVKPADFNADPANPGNAVPASNTEPEFAPSNSAQIVSSEAVIGSAYNIGHVVFRLAPEDTMRWQSRAIFVSDTEGRIQFPVVMPTFIDRLTEQVTDQIAQQPREINVWFLFVGRQPLEVTIHAANDHRLLLQPEPVRRLRQRMMTQNWWRQFNAMLEEQSKASDYPPLVQAYLGSMVQQKMGMQLPLLQRTKNEPVDPMTSTWYLLTGAESLQVDSMRELMLGGADIDAATLPVPQDIAWAAHDFQSDDPVVQVETIAKVVPQECFYLRFGTWANQIWLKQLLDEHGGDLSRMVRLRGYQSMVGDVFRDQLALQSSQLDDLFGGTLIADVAVIGLDTFFNDGAAAGIVFQAKNGLLANSMNQKRSDFAKQHADMGVTLDTVNVGHQQGTLLQSPDGKVRSLMVRQGDFILVTTSFTLAERFLESSQGIRTLGTSTEFLNARREMPLSRDDTIFVYFSTAFLENLLSPHYQIELKRRLRSITEIQILQMATWAAAAQHVPIPNGQSDWDLVAIPDRIAALQAAGLLPRGFNMRPDGSKLALMQDLVWDSPDDSAGSSIESKGSGGSTAPGELKSVTPDQDTQPDDLPSGLELEGPDRKLTSTAVQNQSSQTEANQQEAKPKSGSLFGSMLGVLSGGKSGGGNSQDASGSAANAQDSNPSGLNPLNSDPPSVLSQQSRPLQPLPTAAASNPNENRQVAFDDVRDRSAVGGLLFGDTQRGVRGWMIPVADMPIAGVTPAEQQWYQQRAQYFADNWGQTDPIMIGIKRYKLADSKERVVFDGRVAPFGSEKYTWLTDNIGAPMYLRPAKSPDDVIRLEASIAEGALLQSVGAHQLFASVQRDAQQLSSVDPGEWWTTLKLIQDTPGYIGSWPTAGWLDLLPMLGGRPDADGFTHSIGRKVWRMQHEGFSVVATDRQRLEQLRPHLEMVEAEHAAQLRLEVADLNDTQLAAWTNALWRQRSWQASVANTRLLHLLMQHFQMPAEKAKQNAQSLLNAKLVCSLDGQYQLRGPINPDPASQDTVNQSGVNPDDALQSRIGAVDPRLSPLSYFWVSDRWPNDNQQAAEAWSQEQSPLLKWFRGAMLEVLQEDQRFLVHGYLDISREVKETASLPGFDLFQGFSFK